MKSLHLFLMFFILLCFFQANAVTSIKIATDGNVTISATYEKNMIGFRTYNLFLKITNNGSSAIINYPIRFDFSTDNSSVKNFVLDYSSLDDPLLTENESESSIYLKNLDAGASVTLTLPMASGCNSILSNQEPVLTGMSYTIFPGTGPIQLKPDDISVEKVYLSPLVSSFINVQNFPDGYLGTIFDRTFVLTSKTAGNNNLKIAGIISFKEKVNKNTRIKSIALYAGAIKIAEKTLDFEYNPSDTRTDNDQQIMDVSLAFDKEYTSSEIKIIETLEILNCVPDGGYTSEVLISAGPIISESCVDILGDSRNAWFITKISKGKDMPKVVFQNLLNNQNVVNYVTCIPDLGTIKRKYKVVNTGNAPATNIVLYIPHVGNVGWGNLTSFMLEGTFKINNPLKIGYKDIDVERRGILDLSGNKPVTINNTTITYPCFQSGEKIIHNFSYEIEKLNPGEYLEVEWTEKICCFTNSITTSTSLNNCFVGARYNFCGVVYKSFSGRENEAEVNYNNEDPKWLTGHYGIIPNVHKKEGSNSMFGCVDCKDNKPCWGNPEGKCTDVYVNKKYTGQYLFENGDLNGVNGGNPFPVNFKNYRIIVDFVTDGMLIPAPDISGGTLKKNGNLSFVNRYGEYSLQPVDYRMLTSSEISEFGLPAVGLPTGVRATFFPTFEEMKKLHDWQGISSAEQLVFKNFIDYFNSLDLQFDVSALCGRPQIDGAYIGRYHYRIYLQPEFSCTSCLFPLTFYSGVPKPVKVNCPGCELPGLITGSVGLERITLGLNDGDDNGIPDEIGLSDGKHLNDNANRNMASENDLIKSSSVSSFWGGENISYLDLEANFGEAFLDELYRFDVFGSDKLDVFTDINHPVTLIFTGSNGKKYKIEFTDKKYIQENAGTFLFRFPASVIKATYPDFVKFNPGDQYEITVFYKVKDFDLEPAIYYEDMGLSSRVYLSGTEKKLVNFVEHGEDDPWQIAGSISGTTRDLISTNLKPYFNYLCEANDAGIVLADFKQSSYVASSETAKCNPGQVYVISSNDDSAPNLNLYPFEIRERFRPDKIIIPVPSGYSINPNNPGFTRLFYSFRLPKQLSYQTPYQDLELSYKNFMYVGDQYNEFNEKIAEMWEYTGFKYPSSPLYTDNEKTYIRSHNEYAKFAFVLNVNPNCSTGSYFPILRFRSSRASDPRDVYYKKEVVTDFFYSRQFDFATADYKPLNTIPFKGETGLHWPNQENTNFYVNIKGDQNIYLSKNRQRITFSATGEKGGYKFIYFRTDNSKFIIDNVYVNNSGTPVAKVDGVYQLSADTYDAFEFTMEVSYRCSSDEVLSSSVLDIYYGNDCAEYPKLLPDGSLSKQVCFTNKKSVSIFLDKYLLADPLHKTIANSSSCTGGLSHSLDITSAANGEIYISKVFVFLPSGLAFDKTKDAYFILSDGTKIKALPTIVNINGKQKLEWIAENILFDPIGNFELYGFSNKTIKLNYYTKVDNCTFSGDVITGSVTVKSYCDESVIKTFSENIPSVICTIAGKPVLSLSQTPLNECEGGKTTLNATISPAGTYSCKWYQLSTNEKQELVWTLLSETSSALSISGTVAGSKYKAEVIYGTQNCVSSEVISLNVKKKPKAGIAGNAKICSGESTELRVAEVTDGATYSWFADDKLILENESLIRVSPEKTTIFTLKAILDGCETTGTTTIRVMPAPVAYAGEDITICQYNSATIGSSPGTGVRYTWTPDIWLSNSSISNPVVSPGSDITYTLTAKNEACQSEDQITVKVISLPTPVISSSRESICKGQEVIISVPAQTGVKYQWFENAVLNTSYSSNEITVKPEVTTLYSVTADNKGCKASAETKITVNPLPVADAGADKVICEGDSVQLGSPAISKQTYAWTPIIYFDDYKKAQPKVGPEAGTYTFVVWVGDGNCTAADQVNVTVNPSPVANAGSDQVICKGRSVTIGAAPAANETYSWTPFSGLQDAFKSITTARPSATTQYILEARLGSCADKDTVLVTVSKNNFDVHGPLKVCKGETVKLIASGGDFYKWTPDPSILSADLSFNTIDISPVSVTTYQVKISDVTGCSELKEWTVTATEGPLVEIQPQGPVCKDETIIMSALVKCARPFEGKCKTLAAQNGPCNISLPDRGGDLIIIGKGKTYSLDSDPGGNIRIDGGGKLVLCGGLINLSDKLTIGDGELVINSGTTVYLGTLDIKNSNAVLINNGTILMGSPSAPGKGNLTVTGKFLNIGSIQVEEFNLNSNAAFENYGTVKVNNSLNSIQVKNYGTIEILGDYKDNGNSTFENYCTLKVGRNLHIDKKLFNYGSITVSGETFVNGSSEYRQQAGSSLKTKSFILNKQVLNSESECSKIEVTEKTIINIKNPFSGNIGFCADLNKISSVTGAVYSVNCSCNLNAGGYTGGYAYKWGPSENFTDPTLDRQTITPEIGKEYIVTITDADGKTANAAVIYNLDLNCNPTGIESLLTENKINVFPNPTADNFVLYRENLSELQVQIYSPLGILIHSTKLKENSGRFSLSGMPSGCYLIKVSENEKVTFFKVIKQ